MNDQTSPTASGAGADGIPERFVPDEMRGQLVGAEHIGRYSWAAGFCDGRRVLDAGCGVGYGAELLNRAGASEVVAVDVSEAAIELARSGVSAGVTCEIGDVNALSYEDDSFDVAVCFEVIEHVDDQERVLDELARVLRPDGLLLVSSPNRDRYVPGNPHHRHEYIRSELQAVLDARFPSARIISQHVMLASVISWSGAPQFEGAQTHRSVDAEPDSEDEVYLLAMAGAELPPDPSPVVSLGKFPEARRWLEHIDAQQRHIHEQARHIEELEGQEDNRRAALARLAAAEQELAQCQAQEDVAKENLASAQALQTAQATELRSLRTMANSKSWRLTAPLRRISAEAKRRR